MTRVATAQDSQRTVRNKGLSSLASTAQKEAKSRRSIEYIPLSPQPTLQLRTCHPVPRSTDAAQVPNAQVHNPSRRKLPRAVCLLPSSAPPFLPFPLQRDCSPAISVIFGLPPFPLPYSQPQTQVSCGQTQAALHPSKHPKLSNRLCSQHHVWASANNHLNRPNHVQSSVGRRDLLCAQE
jgi:hypothetical protein